MCVPNLLDRFKKDTILEYKITFVYHNPQVAHEIREQALQNVTLAGSTQGLFFDVDLADSGREVHHTAFVVAVFETERVTDFVDDLLSDAVSEDFRRRPVRESAIGTGVQAIRGDDTAVTAEVSETENVVSAVIEQVFRRDSDILGAGSDAFGEVDELLGAVLVARGVVRPFGDRLCIVNADLAVVH